MKNKCLLLFILLGLTLRGEAAMLTGIRLGYFPEKIRVVFDFDAPFTYLTEEAQGKIKVYLPKTDAASTIQTYVEVNDIFIHYLEVEKFNDDLQITIPFNDPVPYKVFPLNNPARLAIDFDRNFMKIISGGTVLDGIELMKVACGSTSGKIVANVIKVDLNKAEVAPALARKNKPNPLESFISLFNPWKEKDDDYHFYRARVSSIAKEQGASAAINGTFFAYTGKPLGTLLIDKELVSSPIYDRSALILTDDHQAFIDNILIDCYFKAPNLVRYNITGVNQGRGKESVVMYTPAWGEKTGTDKNGLELTIENSLVKSIKLGNSDIPPSGYVLSMSGPSIQFLSDNLKVGDKIDCHIKIIPYTTSPKTILHMISGGPRLVKNGVAYVSKNEEKFRADIAKGRAARTAVGITRDNQIILVAVDGLARGKNNKNKEKKSIGMTLEELSDLMINLGAVEALNLDGGSSTTMWADGQLINQPVSGSETKVSNAIVVRPWD